VAGFFACHGFLNSVPQERPKIALRFSGGNQRNCGPVPQAR
jgi:hypothetical protein